MKFDICKISFLMKSEATWCILFHHFLFPTNVVCTVPSDNLLGFIKSRYLSGVIYSDGFITDSGPIGTQKWLKMNHYNGALIICHHCMHVYLRWDMLWKSSYDTRSVCYKISHIGPHSRICGESIKYKKKYLTEDIYHWKLI